MRLIRVGALFGSLVLLVATAVSLINQRSELFDSQDTRVSSAAMTATNSVHDTLLRARAAVEVAVAGVADAEPEALLATFDDAAEACVGRQCSGPDLAVLDSFGEAVGSVSVGESVAVIDDASGSVLVIGRAENVVVSIQLPSDALVGPLAADAIATFGTDYDVILSGTQRAVETTEIRTVDGRRVIDELVAEPLASGVVLIRSTVPNDVGWGADDPGRYALLFGVGTVLLALAGGTALTQSRKLERRATTDDLTGLVNRREFERLSEEALDAALRFNTGLSVMLIDLNGFKQINDTLGHQFGDLVLKGCAERLVEAVRDTDVVGRWGGDEFVVLLPGLHDASGIRSSAERIGHHLSSTPVAGDVSISGSIGASLYPRHGSTLDELMQAADVAMYEAKTTGVLHRLASNTVVDSSTASPDYAGPDRRKSINQSDDAVVN